MTRKYSVAEIDCMRDDVEFIVYEETHGGANRADYSTIVENRLRTYMLNGTEPQELTDKANTYRAKYKWEKK